jgi:hypothetical protein
VGVAEHAAGCFSLSYVSVTEHVARCVCRSDIVCLNMLPGVFLRRSDSVSVAEHSAGCVRRSIV